MAIIGDLVARAGMDTSGIARGAREMQDQIATATARGAGMARQNLNQAAFAAQDFMSVLSMGGSNAIGRAFMSVGNNLQMLTIGLPGPIGMIATMGATLGAVLIPELLKGANAGKDFADSISTIAHQVDMLIARESSGIAFFHSIGDMDTEKSVEKAMRQNETETEQLTNERKRRLEQQKKFIIDSLFAGVAKGRGGDVEQYFDKASGRFLGGVTSEDPEFRKRVNDLTDVIDDLDDRIMRRGRRGELLESRLPTARALEEQKKAEEEFKKMEGEGARLMEQSKNSGEQFADKLQRIKELTAEGIFNPFQATDLMDRAFQEFKRSQQSSSTDRAIKGEVFGTTAEYSGALAAIRQDQRSNDTELVELNRKLLEEQKNAVRELQRIAQNLPKEEGI